MASLPAASGAETGTRPRSSNPAETATPKTGPVAHTTREIGQGSGGTGIDAEIIVEPPEAHSNERRADPPSRVIVEEAANRGQGPAPLGAAATGSPLQSNAAHPWQYAYQQYPYIYSPYPYMPPYPPPGHHGPAAGVGYHQQNQTPLTQPGNQMPPEGTTPPIITFPETPGGGGAQVEIPPGNHRGQGPARSGQKTITNKKTARSLELELERARKGQQSETGSSTRGGRSRKRFRRDRSTTPSDRCTGTDDERSASETEGRHSPPARGRGKERERTVDKRRAEQEESASTARDRRGPQEEKHRGEKKRTKYASPTKEWEDRGRRGRRIDEDAVKRMIERKVEEKVAAMEKLKPGGHSQPIGLGDGPLSTRIYKESVGDFKYPATLPSFRGSKDSQDPRNFVAGFVERLSLMGATDAMLCRVFTTCLAGEAWDWYMGLARGSIYGFDDLAKAFLTRYALIRPPQVTCDMLFDIVQGSREGTRSFITRFMETARRVQNLNEGLALTALRKGLRKEGPATLRYDSHIRKIESLGEFVEFAQGYIQAEEDNGGISKPKPRSPAPVEKGWQREDNTPRSYGAYNGGRSGRGEKKRKTGVQEYRQHFLEYAPFVKKKHEMLNIVKEMVDLPGPMYDKDFGPKDMRKHCAYHDMDGHSTEDCKQLRDILERLAREGKLVEWIPREFYKASAWKYDGVRGKRFKRTTPYKDSYKGPRCPEQRMQNQVKGNTEPVEREPTPTIHVISGGHRSVASERPPRTNTKPYPSVFTVEAGFEKKRSRSEEAISFSEKDFQGITWPHDDPVVLKLKIGEHRVKRVLVDTGSSADILYLSTFKQMGYPKERLQGGATPLIGFTGDSLRPKGVVRLKVAFGEAPKIVEVMVNFLVVSAPSAYNAIIGRGTLNQIGAIVSSPHLKVKFHTTHGVGEERGHQEIAKDCYLASIQGQGGAIHQVDRKASRTAKGTRKPDEATIDLDPTDRGPSGGGLEPIDEIEQVEVEEGKFLNVGKAVQGKARDELITLLKESRSVFAWTAEDMPGIPRSVAEHRLPTKPGVKPVRQKQRAMGPERKAAVQKEVEKLLKAGFIRNVEYPEWMANPVLVKKSNGDWRMCIDYTDLNRACPMDPFPLPKIDQLVDSTSGHAFLSFMDAFSGYNQIRMNLADEEKTAFTTHVGLYCYKVMPFGLKNAGATFQRMVNRVFSSQIGRNVEAYVDDMLVKSTTDLGHVEDLKETFATLNRADMKLNPQKSFFGLTGGKFLGFMVSIRGIEIHPSKSRAILQMTPPRNLKELQCLTGRLAALNRFIAKLGDVCFPFFKAMRKGAKFEWTEECAGAFEKIKQYLADPPRLSRPTEGDTLALYLATTGHAVSVALVREEGKEQSPIYFVSHVLRDAETRYTQIEKAAYALVIAARKLRPYFQSHAIKVYTSVPLKKAFANFDSSGRLLKWALEISEFDISFHPQTAQKSQIFADFIAEYSGVAEVIEDRWTVYVDGAASPQGSGAGVSLTGPRGEVFNYALHFKFTATNNMAEYEAMIAGLKLAKGVGAKHVLLRSDSELAVKQLNAECRILDEKMRKYHEQLQTLQEQFEKVEVEHVPRSKNCQADALSKLGAAGNLDQDRPVIVWDVTEPSVQTDAKEIFSINEPGEAWYAPMWKYLTTGTLPADPLEARKLKKISPMYSIFDNCMFKRGYVRPWLRCAKREEADRLIAEVHEGLCGSHQGAKTLAKRVLRAGIYWPTLQQDAADLVKKCKKCQFHAKLSNIPPYAQVSIAGAWPFDLWGIDIVGPFPQATYQRRWIIVAVEYFTKWVEAEALSNIKASTATNFIWRNIICRFGIPHAIISDNGTQFNADHTVEFLEKLGIHNNFTSVSHPASNGLAEVTNRTILEGLKRKVSESRTNWPDKLDEILWTYRTTPREATQQTPYSLVFGMEAVTPLEMISPSLRMVAYADGGNHGARKVDLELVDERREQARLHMAVYQKRIKRAFDKHVSPRGFEPGDLVLRKIEATGQHVAKLAPNWEGPFRVKRGRGIGAYELEDMQGRPIPRTWNACHLRKFYL